MTRLGGVSRGLNHGGNAAAREQMKAAMDHDLALACQTESEGLEREIRRLELREQHRQEPKMAIDRRRRYAGLEH